MAIARRLARQVYKSQYPPVEILIIMLQGKPMSFCTIFYTKISEYFTIERKISERGGKLYFDYLQM